MKELEYLAGGNDFVDPEGDVQSMANYYDGIEYGPKYRPHPHLYDGVDMKNEEEVAWRNWKIIGALIDGSGVDEIENAVFVAEKKHKLAQTALFELPSEAAIISSLEQHPSNQNTTPEQQHTLADGILAEYKKEAEKKHAKLDGLRRSVCFAVLRRLNDLSKEDLELIAVTIGYDKDFFRRSEQRSSGDAEKQELDPDWRRPLQYKDN